MESNNNGNVDNVEEVNEEVNDVPSKDLEMDSNSVNNAKNQGHPPFVEMIKKAIPKSGSKSPEAIAKYIKDNYSVDKEKLKFNFNKALKCGVSDGTLIYMKGGGKSGLYKLGKVEKRIEKPVRHSPRKIKNITKH